jgi:hypothetical protein
MAAAIQAANPSAAAEERDICQELSIVPASSGTSSDSANKAGASEDRDADAQLTSMLETSAQQYYEEQGPRGKSMGSGG